MPAYRFHAALAAALLLQGAVWAAPPAAPSAPAAAPTPPPLRPCEAVTVDPPLTLALGKSRIVRLPFPVARLVVGGQSSSRAGKAGQPGPAPAGAAAPATAGARDEWDGVADIDVTLLSPTELYFLGRRAGSMNVILQSADGRCLVKDLQVSIDPDLLQAKLQELMPEQTGIRVRAADHAMVLTGTVSDAIKLDQVLTIASAYGDGKKVVNLLRIDAPQQVMLEVTIAEVSKTLLDKFGLDFSRGTSSGNSTRLISGLLGGGAVTLARGTRLLGIDAQKKDGLVRILAEPNIMAISGQTASFLSGGKIFIPVAQSRDSGGSTITLEEKEFGVGLKFTPTVLDGSRINLKLISEASELSQTGSPFTSFNGVTSVLPSISTRRVDTTVQLNDGQSFVVAGLIKNNFNEALDRLPGLGEVPLMGALFRSTEFQTDQTELMFVVTPRLVRALSQPPVLPTDNHVTPTRGQVMFEGKGEGTPATSPARP